MDMVTDAYGSGVSSYCSSVGWVLFEWCVLDEWSLSVLESSVAEVRGDDVVSIVVCVVACGDSDVTAVRVTDPDLKCCHVGVVEPVVDSVCRSDG